MEEKQFCALVDEGVSDVKSIYMVCIGLKAFRSLRFIV